MDYSIKTERISADIVIVGGGTSGCFAAARIKEINPQTEVLVVEKAHIKRSGCLSAGVNAINAYINPGETPESYLEYVKKDCGDLVREDLVFSIGQRLNNVAKKLESWGLPFIRDGSGIYMARGKRSVEIIGEHIKPIMAAKVEASGVKVLNRTVATNYIIEKGQVVGIFAFAAREKKFYVISAKAVICATGGAAGIYRPNNDGSSRHRMWYCPYNVGTGFAMGLRAGAEMTTFEMRFIALRIKDVMSPTGTVMQGVRARQVNALGEEYLNRYAQQSTPYRMYATVEENKAGRGPCYLKLNDTSSYINEKLKEAYLSMSPMMVLKLSDEGIGVDEKPLEICGSEPYIVGGHGQAGYWVDLFRQTNIKGLFAAGDVAGGAPKKYVTGCLAEGEIAARAASEYIKGVTLSTQVDEQKANFEHARVFTPLGRTKGFKPHEYEERLQKIMDEYAGGIATNYELCAPKLFRAKELLNVLSNDVEGNITASDSYELVKAHEVIDRVLVARALVEHLLYRKETRWRSYQERIDYPQRDDHRWFVFVNSIYSPDRDAFELIERPVAENYCVEMRNSNSKENQVKI